MSEEQKFQITAKLCQEVLAAIVDGGLPLQSSTEVLSDTLAILGSKDIKISNSNRNNNTEEDEEQQALAVAKEKLLSKVTSHN
jgi:condensin-2 complex subunit D3